MLCRGMLVNKLNSICNYERKVKDYYAFMPLIITRKRSEPYWESVKEMKIQNNETLNQFHCQKDPIDETKTSHNNNV